MYFDLIASAYADLRLFADPFISGSQRGSLILRCPGIHPIRTSKNILSDMQRKLSLSVLMICLAGTLGLAQTRFATIPETTVLKDSLKSEIGKAPYDFAAVKPEMVYNISAKGYDPMYMIFKKSKETITFPEGLADCEPCLMEFNGSPFDPDVEKNAKLRLRKKVVDRRQSIMLGVLEPRLDISAETVVAHINGKKIKLGNDDIHLTMGYTQNLTHPLVKGLVNVNLDAYDFDERRKATTRTQMAKLLVRPVIKSLAYRLDGKILREYTGPGQIECEWQFYYSADTSKILGRIRSTTTVYRTAPDLNLPVHNLILQAAWDLSSNDTIFAYLDKLEKDYMSAAVSKPTLVTKVPAITYTSQQDMIKKVSKAIVTVELESGHGSGIIIDPSGIILTNHHVVIEDTTELMIKISGYEESFPARVIMLNSDYDLALLEITPGKYPAVSLSTQSALEIGDAVFAIGTPLDKSLGQTVTKGIASGFRTLNGIKYIQTDVTINPGNSGGALINESGHLIGIPTWKVSHKSVEGIGFCIPSETVEQALGLRYK
jgi:serine protease Do